MREVFPVTRGGFQSHQDVLRGAPQPLQVRKWANAGLIPCHRVPGTRKYRFLRDEILGWLKELPSASAEDEEEEETTPATS